MRNGFKSTRTILGNAVLLAALLGVLIVYPFIASDLPSRLYTSAQKAFITQNYSRSINQFAPAWNFVQQDGAIVPTILPVRESRVRATLVAHYEEQERLSVTLYDLDFHAEYLLINPDWEITTIELFFPFPSNLETLHDVEFLVDGEEPQNANFSTGGIIWQAELEKGEQNRITISYKADGATSFTYGLIHDQRSDVDVVITVAGLTGSSVSDASLPPTANVVSTGSETFTWDYDSLIANRDIQLTLPTRLSFVQRVTYLQDDFRALAAIAPLLVGLFLVSMAGILQLSGTRLGLQGYLLIGCGMALFYPLLTFSSGLIDVLLAAPLVMLLISALLLNFLRLLPGWREIRWRASWLILIFLGVFSLGMLTPWRGLFLSGGGLLLIGVFMLAYTTRSLPEEPEPIPARQPIDEEPETVLHHCPSCGFGLEDGYSYCPGCGYDARHFRKCDRCGSPQFIPSETVQAHCFYCGHLLSTT